VGVALAGLVGASLAAPTQDGLISSVTGFEEYYPVWLWDFASIGVE
jgi:hypothetical protein